MGTQMQKGSCLLSLEEGGNPITVRATPFLSSIKLSFQTMADLGTVEAPEIRVDQILLLVIVDIKIVKRLLLYLILPMV